MDHGFLTLGIAWKPFGPMYLGLQEQCQLLQLIHAARHLFWRRVLGCHVTTGYMLMVSPPEKKTTQPKLSLGSRKQWSIVFFLYQYQDVFVPYNMVCKLQHNNDEITCHSKVPALKLNLGVCCRFLGPSFTSNTFVPTTTLEDTRTAAASYPSTTNGPTLAASKAGAKMKTWFY